MIAVDTNVLVASHRADAEAHGLARAAVVELAQGVSPWSIPWPCIHEFFRVVTGIRVFLEPTPPATALAFLRGLMQSDSLAMIGEGPTHFDTLERLVMAGRVSGAMVHDARIAAICLANGVRELWTADRDFSRFPELKTRNPLITADP